MDLGTVKFLDVEFLVGQVSDRVFCLHPIG